MNHEENTTMNEMQFYCAQCGQNFPEQVTIRGRKELTPEFLAKKLKKHKWILQENDDNLDAYCCKECAK